MVNSQNGWPVNPPRAARTVPGSAIKLVVADGPAGDVLLEFAADFDQHVEDIDTAAGGILDDWGWADREIRGGGSISNHASATAIDLNATRHPLGKVGTFTPTQRSTIRTLLGKYGGVIRWGGDYTGRKDEMHFEINAPLAQVAALAARLKEDDMPTPNEIWSADLWHHYENTPEGKKLAESLGNRPGDLVEEHKAGEWITAMAVRTAVMARQLAVVQTQLGQIASQLAELKASKQ